MLKLYFIIPVLCLLFLACITDNDTYFKEDRLAGQWTVESITFTKAGSLKEENYESNPSKIEIDLYLDGRIHYKTSDKDEWGDWEMHYLDVWSPYYKEAKYQFITTLEHLPENPSTELTGYIYNLTSHHFELHIPNDKGNLKYYFKKK